MLSRLLAFLAGDDRHTTEAPRLPALPPLHLPKVSYFLSPGDPYRLPSTVTLTRRDGTKVVYVPQQQAHSPADALSAPSWRNVNAEWPAS